MCRAPPPASAGWRLRRAKSTPPSQTAPESPGEAGLPGGVGARAVEQVGRGPHDHGQDARHEVEVEVGGAQRGEPGGIQPHHEPQDQPRPEGRPTQHEALDAGVTRGAPAVGESEVETPQRERRRAPIAICTASMAGSAISAKTRCERVA